MWFVCLWGTKEALRKCVSFHMGTAVIQDPVTQAHGSGKAFPVGVKLRAKAKCVQKLAASSFKNCNLRLHPVIDLLPRRASLSPLCWVG